MTNVQKLIEANGSKKLHQVWLRNSEDLKPTECKIKGTIPTWLNGHLMRNGPGEYKVGDDYFQHLFDGHALIHKYDICNGRVTYRSNFIKSKDHKINHEKERIVVAGFGTPSIPDPCKNIFSRFFTKFFTKGPRTENASVNVANLGDAYYAITDGPFVHRLNSETLDSEQFYDFAQIFGMVMSTAHPHTDLNGDYYNMGTHVGKNGYYGIYKVPASSMGKADPMQDMKIHSKVVIESPLKSCYFHSFALSENYITLHEHPVRINVLKLALGSFTWDCIMNAFVHETDRESVFHVVDKNTQETLPIRYCSKGRFTFHHINSYEQTVNEKKYLIVDVCCADGPTFFYFWMHILADENSPEKMKEPHMWPYRFVLPLDVNARTPKKLNLVEIPGCLATAEMREDGSVFLTPELLVEEEFSKKYGMWGVEFPTINYKEFNTKPYKYMYTVGAEANGVYNCLFKTNLETKESIQWKEEGYFPSEPVFVRNPDSSDEDDGVILSSVINLNPQDPIFLLVLDAKTFTELGRAEIMAKLNYSFHGVFSSTK